ncbi:MAG TPA: VWA domain-containing protein, partial [Pirellulaceae bacterium]|nr:VWA domain-containing protein [Pirellulaceae bacterium]
MFADSSQSFPLRLLEAIGVDGSQLPAADAVQFEWANLPGSAGGMVILLVLLLAGYVALYFLRRDVDNWSPLAKFGFMFGSVAGYVLIAWAMLGAKAIPLAMILSLGFWVLWVYRWELETCSSRARMLLAMLRMAVLALLALILFAPEMVPLEKKEIRRTLYVQRDKSQSMAYEDTYRNDDQAKSTAAALGISTDQLRERKPSRAKVLDEVLAKDQYKFLRELEKRGKLMVVDFDDSLTKPIDPQVPLADKTATDLTPVTNAGEKQADEPVERPIKLEPLAADGRGSDLWLAIHDPLARTPAAMVLFTDGQHTGKEDPREAAREALRQNVQLFIVGVGDPSRPKNIRVDSVYVQPNVWQKDEFGVEVAITAQDIDPQNITVELIEQKANDSDGSLGPEKVVQKENVLLDKNRLTKTLKHSLSETGKYTYSVRVTPLEDESDLEDNRRSASPTLVRDKEHLKVLLVAGAPTWEYRLVQKLLTRDETIQVSC